MKIPLLGCVAMACAATAFAGQTQTSTTQAANQTITLSGCVGGGAGASDPFMLSNPMIVPNNPSAARAIPTAIISKATPKRANASNGSEVPIPNNSPATARAMPKITNATPAARLAQCARRTQTCGRVRGC